MRILIVDDGQFDLEVLRTSLTKMGHTVCSAKDGHEALDVLRSTRCRVVISDWQMPRMDGPALCRAVRAADLPGYVYFLLLTGRQAPDALFEGLAAGADDFMSKPFQMVELEARLRTAQRIMSLETHTMTIFLMAKLAESRDTDTGAHLERVRSYCRILALDLGRTPAHRAVVTPEYARLIFQTSPLHDICKVAVPDCVLLKSGRLDDEEFTIMKTHTTAGAATLEAALAEHPEAAFLRMAADIAASHHERWDGKGYPAGLTGARIPLSARIVAVADVYDALTSRRTYKPAFDHAVAKAMILQGRGTQFDPDVVDAFARCQEEFAQVQRRHAAVGGAGAAAAA